MANSFKRLGMIKKYWALILLSGILMLTFLAYSNVLNGEFQFDDILTVEENSNIKYIENIFRKNMWLSYLSGGRPVTDLTFALNYYYGRLDVFPYHVVNIIIHLVVVVLIFLAVRKIFMLSDYSRNEAEIMGLIVSAVFGLHPVNTQAVSYISQRAESLSALFYLLSLLVFIRLMETDTGKKARLTPSLTLPPRGGGGGGGLRLHAKRYTLYAVSVIFFLLALGSKFTAVSLPAMLLLYQIYFLKDRPFYKKLAYVLPFVIVASLLGALFISSLGTSQDIGFSIKEVTPAQYFFTQLRVIITYMRLIILPINQVLDYDYPIYSSFFDPQVFLSFLFLLSLFGFAVYLFYRSRISQPPTRYTLPATRLISFGILWFFITLMPTSSFVPVRDVIFEHRVYLPAIGMILSLTAAGRRVISSIPLRYRIIALSILLITVLSSLTIATYKRNYVWNSRISLWEDVVKKSPKRARGHNNLGKYYLDKKWMDKAIKHFQIAIRLKPDYSDAHYNLGIAYRTKGFIDKAIEQYQIAIRLKPDYVDAYNNLGNVYQSEGLIDRAIEQYQIAIRLKPDPMPYYNLGVAYQSKGLIDKAIGYYQIAIRLKPDYPEAHNNLGNAYLSKGLIDKAIEQYQIAIRIRGEYPEAYCNLGVAYQSKGLINKAIGYYQIVIKLKPDYSDAHYNLGVAYQVKDLIDKAIEQYEFALNLKPNDPDVYDKLGVAYRKKGLINKAEEHFRMAKMLRRQRR